MILKNGKRIDGCTDTLPVGTVQPFLGLTPPLGYLICQGQSISKVEYPELYNICKSTFGTETETHFYLPDLRGRTIAGYHNGDDTFTFIKTISDKKSFDKFDDLLVFNNDFQTYLRNMFSKFPLTLRNYRVAISNYITDDGIID